MIGTVCCELLPMSYQLILLLFEIWILEFGICLVFGACNLLFAFSLFRVHAAQAPALRVRVNFFLNCNQ